MMLSIFDYNFFNYYKPIFVSTSYQSTVFKYFYPIISFFFYSILYLKFWMYSLKNLYSILVRFDSFSKLMMMPVVVPLMRRVSKEFAVTCIKKRFLVYIEYLVFQNIIIANDIPMAPFRPPYAIMSDSLHCSPYPKFDNLG